MNLPCANNMYQASLRGEGPENEAMVKAASLSFFYSHRLGTQ